MLTFTLLNVATGGADNLCELMEIPRRKSMRLRGYDYSQPGGYFVTICTRNRVCTFGEIRDGHMSLSPTGELVRRCWEAIPSHFGNTSVDLFQVMPNHLHGIVKIREHDDIVGVECIQPLRETRGGGQRTRRNRYQHIIPGSLGSIIRSFKAAVTREVRRILTRRRDRIWQRSFYDHVVRSDIDHFFIERYIELNPILWHLDSDNPDAHNTSVEEVKRALKEHLGPDGLAIEYLIDFEMNYRAWKEMEGDL